MARPRKVDHDLLEREYVYDASSPPISFTDLADKYGIARSYIAELARKGKWYEKRKEVRKVVGEKVLDALTDEWAEAEAALRDRMLQSMVKTLDVYDQALADEKVKVGPREAMGVVAAIRVLLGDVAAAKTAEAGPKIIDMDHAPVDPKVFADALPALKQLLDGKGGADGLDAALSRLARTDAAPSAARTVED